MIRSRLLWEVLFPYLTFALLATAAAVTAGAAVAGHAARRGLVGRLEAAAAAVAARPGAFVAPTADWAGDLRRLGGRLGVRLTAIDADGTVLADGEADPALLGGLGGEPELRDARRDGIGVRDVVRDGRPRVAVAVAAEDTRPAPGPPAVIGFVRAEGPADEVAAAVRRWRLWAVAAGTAAAAAGLVWSAVTAVRLTRPVEAFARSAAAIGAAGGGPSGSGGDEPLPRLKPGHALAPLSAALDAMGRRVAGRLDALGAENRGLTATRERLTAVLTGMAEGVVAVGADERILFVNPAAARLLDLSEAASPGRPVWEAVRLPALTESARAALAGAESAPVEVELPRSGPTVAVRASRLPGEPCPGVVLVLHDVTELRRLENLRREFVSNVSHELKTPLASIQAYTETLLEGAVDDPGHNRKFLGRIAEQADRLHHLILDVLRLARIEAGTDVFDIRRLSAGAIVEACVDGHAAVARTKGIALAAEPPAEPVRVRADADGLRTILDNLVDNALNYTPAGGRVTVRWGRTSGEAVVEVTDTGIGIPPEHQARIFERFHRVDQARSREHGGTGLGLAIVKHLAGVFGGRVEVESEAGRGSTFRVTLPLA